MLGLLNGLGVLEELAFLVGLGLGLVFYLPL